MSALAPDATWLAGKHVAFTGRLASMTRAEAAKLVEAHGGMFVTLVSRNTSFLVVGQEGLPLTKDGALSNKLQKARELDGSADIRILSEEEFFDRLGATERGGGVHRLFSTAQLCRLLRVPRDRLRSWLRQGLIQPAQTSQGVGLFDFQQVTSVKMLWELAQAGVTTSEMRRSLEQLRQWLPGTDEPLAQLALIERDGRLLVRLDEGQLAEPSGQLRFDFAGDLTPTIVEGTTAAARSAEDWWNLGHEQEENGQLAEAAQSYRQALLAGGPCAHLCFNLGNVLCALGQKGQAAERFRQAVELDRSFVEAWNNLGNVLTELGQLDDALAAFRAALKLQPAYADAHYNLADALEQAGRLSEARSHWHTYVRLEPAGPWAQYARRRLSRSG
jgi:tetratricopeptide (TPR) repeat protein